MIYVNFLLAIILIQTVTLIYLSIKFQQLIMKDLIIYKTLLLILAKLGDMEGLERVGKKIDAITKDLKRTIK